MTDNNAQRDLAASRTRTTVTASGPLRVHSACVEYLPDAIHARYVYNSVTADIATDGSVLATPRQTTYAFRTSAVPRKTGLLQVGWGGNNGTTLTAAVFANRHGLSWRTRAETHVPNYKGSLTQAATMRLGFDQEGRDVFVPMASVVPLVSPEDLVLGGWDISGMNLADAMDRAAVLEPDLTQKLRPHMEPLVPMKGVFDPEFIAKNQRARADNVMEGDDKGVYLEQLRADIRDFKEKHGLDYVVVLWTGNSERYAQELDGVNDTAANLRIAIKNSHKEVSPSTLYCVAAIMEGCAYVNGSPQNTFVPGVIEMAREEGALICGDDFKSGQTKLKSVLADYLIGCGVKIRSMVTYNHLGNNDMYQLTDEVMWKPKSASKSRVIEDIVDANGLLYPTPSDSPDHVVVVKYVPFLGDSKRDVSEYTSETFMDCHYTTVMHNECLDSALCAPLMLDLTIFAELFSRVTYATPLPDGTIPESSYSSMEPALSALAFYMKLPRTPPHEPTVHALARQKACIENLLRALVGLPPESHLLLETKFPPTTQ